MTVPEIRARSLDEFNRTLRVAAGVLAKRTGRADDDLAVRVFTGAVFGIMIAVTMPYHENQVPMQADMFERVDEALALLEAGLPL
jgi:hypothetical protein